MQQPHEKDGHKGDGEEGDALGNDVLRHDRRDVHALRDDHIHDVRVHGMAHDVPHDDLRDDMVHDDHDDHDDLHGDLRTLAHDERMQERQLHDDGLVYCRCGRLQDLEKLFPVHLSRSWLEIRAHQRRSLPFYRHHEHRCNRMNLSCVRSRPPPPLGSYDFRIHRQFYNQNCMAGVCDDSDHNDEEHHGRHDEEWRRRVQVHADIHDRLDDGQDNDGKPKRQPTGGRGDD